MGLERCCGWPWGALKHSGMPPRLGFHSAGLRSCGGWRRDDLRKPSMGKPNSNSNAKEKSKSAKKSTVACRPQTPRRRHAPARPSTPASSRSTVRDGTKAGRIVEMLRAPAGATIAGMMSATGWQSHSVRGFLAGMVRKKLKLNLVSEPSDKGRIYRVKERRAQTAQKGVGTA
jgi:hypothetical protein